MGIWTELFTLKILVVKRIILETQALVRDC